MSMRDLENAFELINGVSNAHFHGPQPDALIAVAEGSLNLVFPPTYRTFLSRLGCGGVPGFECYGIVDEDFEKSSVPDAVWVTNRIRQTSKVPVTLIFVSSTGDGGYYCIDVSQEMANGESPVVEWWPGLTDAVGNGRIVASDFGTFFFEQVREAIENI